MSLLASSAGSSLAFDRVDFDARRSAALPSDTVLGMFFSGVLKNVEAQGHRARAAELRERHGKGGWHDLKAYPASSFLELIFDVVGDAASRGADREQALRDVGHACTTVFFGTITGKVLLTLWARGGPPQLVPNIPKAYAMSVRIGHRSYLPISPTSGRVQFRGDVLPPLFCEGSFLAAFDAIGAKARVTTEVRALLDVDFAIDWSAQG